MILIATKTFSTDSLLEKKAELIADDVLFIPKDLHVPYVFGRSTAGPSSGSLSVAFAFFGKRIKMNVSRKKEQQFHLVKNKTTFSIFKEGKPFLDSIEFLPIRFHAPEQIFLNIDDRCIYNCVFCTVPRENILSQVDNKDFERIIRKALDSYNYSGVALTSGIYPNTKQLLKKICNLTHTIKLDFPKIPIGVEIYISSKDDLLLLRDAGVNEIKINLQIPDKQLFQLLCPDLDYDHLNTMLAEAVTIFGAGKVTSNLLYGFGEEDSTIKETMEHLLKKGVIPNLRKVRINEYNKVRIEKVLSSEIPHTSVSRIINLAEAQKHLLHKYHLTTQSFSTMCFQCGCCDLIPFVDL